MKKVFLSFVMFLSISAYGQVVINSTYKPMTYDEIAAPLIQAQRALEQAVETFDMYFTKALKAYREEDYETALYYYERCKEINRRFDNRIYDPDDLNRRIQDCQSKIK